MLALLVSTLILGIAPALIALAAPLVKVGVTAALTWLGYRIENYYATKTKGEKASQRQLRLEEFARAAYRAVLVTQQTFVDDLLEKSADGKLSDSEKRQAFSKAADELMRTLSPDVEEALRAELGQQKFGALLVSEIEQAISTTKYPTRVEGVRARAAAAAPEMKGLIAEARALAAQALGDKALDPDRKK